MKLEIMKTYTEETVQPELKNLEDWKFSNNAIEKKFKFLDFSQALAFIVQLGILAEKKNHHPELLNVYNKVTIRLTTHDANGVTDKDIDLAKAIEQIKTNLVWL
jgi:4a-hydroxytetrahydrobiopterin dehydratase